MAVGREAYASVNPRYRRSIGVAGAVITQRGIARNQYVEHYEDFLGKAGSTLVKPWVATKTGASTNNVVDHVSSASDGQYKLLHSADSEAQTMVLNWGDSLEVNMSKRPRIEIRAKINWAGANFSADQRAVFGLASTYNATLDNIATNAWFRIEGANLNILTECDDGTTDTDDTDSGVDAVDDTFNVYEIDCTSLSSVEYRIDGVLVASKSMAALAANTLVQPIIAMQRDAGTEAEDLRIDYVHISWDRS